MGLSAFNWKMRRQVENSFAMPELTHIQIVAPRRCRPLNPDRRLGDFQVEFNKVRKYLYIMK